MIRIAVALSAGTLVGVGLWLAVGAVAGWQLLPDVARWRTLATRTRSVAAAFAGSAAAGVAAWLLTGWFAAGLLTALAVASLPKLLAGGRSRQGMIDKTEAIASWTESIRDTMAAASGLEEALVATAAAPPDPIADPVRRLAIRLRHQPLSESLVQLGDEIDHPSADMVVTALRIAAQMEAADLSSLLSRLATSIRGDATMRVRVEVSRAKLRTSAKIIVGAVGATLALLMLFNRSYLDAYDTVFGQFMLAVVGAIFAVGGWLMASMSTIELPDRFVPRRMDRP